MCKNIALSSIIYQVKLRLWNCPFDGSMKGSSHCDFKGRGANLPEKIKSDGAIQEKKFNQKINNMRFISADIKKSSPLEELTIIL